VEQIVLEAVKIMGNVLEGLFFTLVLMLASFILGILL